MACFLKLEYTLPEPEAQEESQAEGFAPIDGEGGINPTENPPLGEGEMNAKEQPPEDAIPEEAHCQPIPSAVRNFPKLQSDVIAVRAEIKNAEELGALLVEIVRHDEEKGSIAVFNVACNLVTQIDYQIPKNIGSVYAVYFADVDGEGPSEDDIIGMSEIIDTTKEKEIRHTITLKKGMSLTPLTLPFLPWRQDVVAPQQIGNEDQLPPPINEPEPGLPDPVQDTGKPPKEVSNIEDIVVDPDQDEQLEDLPPPKK